MTWQIISLPQGRNEEIAIPALADAATIKLSKSAPITQNFLATGQPIVGLTLFSSHQSLNQRPLLLTVHDTSQQRSIEARPLKYEYRDDLLAIIFDFSPITSPAKTPLRFSVTSDSPEPISLILGENSSYLAYALRHPTATPEATRQGVLVGLITLLASLLISWLPRRQYLAASLLILIILPLATAGFWFSPDQWGQSDWNLYFPMHEVYRQTILTHHTLPLWNPYTYGGVSALGDPEFSVLTPTFLLQLIFGVPSGFKFAILFSIVVSGLGMLALSQRLKLSPPAAFLTAFAFPLSSTVLLKFVEGHIQHLAIAWIPWLFWSYLITYRSIQSNQKNQARPLSHLTNPHLILTGFILALMFYQGGIYLLFYIIPALFVLSLLTKKPSIAIAATLGAGLWSFGFSAFKLLPVLAWIREFPDDKFVSSSFSLPYWYEIYLRPHLHGAKILPNQSGGWHEYGAYIGPVILLLALLSLSYLHRSRIIRILLIGTILAATVAAAGPILEPLFNVLSWLPRSNISRLALFSVLTSVLLAGFGLDILRRHHSRIGMYFAPTITGLAAISIMSLSYPMSQQAFTVPPVFPPVDPAPSPISFTNNTHRLQINGANENRSYASALAGYGTLSYRPPLAPPLAVIPENADYSQYLTVSHPNASAQLLSWQPNKVVVSVESTDSTEIILNSNYSKGWRANRSRAINIAGRVAAPIPAGHSKIVFRYRPPGIYLGLLISLTTVYLATIHRYSRKSSK